MTLPALAPSTKCSLPRTTLAVRRVPSDNDWTSLYLEIERLYVLERRRLRYVVQYVETKYGFKATEQMYKKRFIKWGLQKNFRRSNTLTPSTTSTTSRRSSHSEGSSSIPPSPSSSDRDNLSFIFLTSVRTWSLSFYESVRSDAVATSCRRSWPEGVEQVNFVFKLVIEMLNRGQGVLAGRVARKAFLMVEEMISLEGPALVWNLLEIMHFMLTSHHSKLFHLLLTHLVALVGSRMSRNHPLPTILRVLRVMATNSPHSTYSPRNILATSPASPSPLTSKDMVISDEMGAFPGELLPMLERAWTLNAEILFNHFDQRLFQLYIRVHWDSCSMEPLTAIIDAARDWLTHASSPLTTTEKTRQKDYFIPVTRLGEDTRFRQLFATPVDAVLPPNYQTLCANSIAALQNHARSIIDNRKSSTSDTVALLPILAGLVTARIIADLRSITTESDVGIGTVSSRSRAQAGNTAGAIRTLLELSDKYARLGMPLDKVEGIRSIIALLEYCDTGADPRVIREMWLLEDALIVARQFEEASNVRKLTYERSEQYLQDIPVDSVFY